MLSAWGPWAERRYFLDKMTLRELVVAYMTHYSIIVYFLVAASAIMMAWLLADGAGPTLMAASVTVLLYPLVEYLMHRYLLHAKILYKSPLTAKVWKRIHFDHHQNPHDLSVLFGALYTTLPTIALITLPLGGLIGGWSGAFASLASGLLIFSAYEFCHCVQHLPFSPGNSWLREIKRRHLAHHFHSERGNYGITSNLFDWVFGTLYEHARDIPKSPTTHNLGYAGEDRERYPWVAQFSETDEEYVVRRTRRTA